MVVSIVTVDRNLAYGMNRPAVSGELRVSVRPPSAADAIPFTDSHPYLANRLIAATATPYGCFGVLYSTSFWNGFQTVS